MKLSCYIVRDLLSSYIEHLTSEETSNDIRTHLLDCKECQEIYENMSCAVEDAPAEKSELLTWMDKIRKTYFARMLLGISVLLFVFFRMIGYDMGRYSLLQYEGVVYVVLVSVSVWYVCKDLFQAGKSRQEILLLLHGMVFCLSVFTAVWAYVTIGGTQEQLDHMVRILGGSSRAGIHLFWILNGEMILLLAAIVYGLYASITKSKQYFGLVSHGYGSLITIFFFRVLLSTMMLPLDYSKEQQIREWLSIAGPYAIGLVLTILYFFFIKSSLLTPFLGCKK